MWVFYCKKKCSNLGATVRKFRKSLEKILAILKIIFIINHQDPVTKDYFKDHLGPHSKNVRTGAFKKYTMFKSHSFISARQ